MNEEYWRAQVAVTRHYIGQMHDAIEAGFNAVNHTPLRVIAEDLSRELHALSDDHAAVKRWAARYLSKS